MMKVKQNKILGKN